MSTPSSKTVVVGWNGLRLEAPKNWETIVSGHNHLIFEDDFQPVLQLRWQTVAPLKPGDWRKKSEEWWHRSGLQGREEKFPAILSTFQQNFSHSRYFQGKDNFENGGVCYCSTCHTLLIFQLLQPSIEVEEKRAKLLGSLRCHGGNETLWSIQDFSLTTPLRALLLDYSFKAGLSRLSFTCDNYSLQVCRLAQAKERLASQSLENLLLTMAGTEKLEIETTKDPITCYASRSPNITKQILLRLKKEKPFIEARLWHLADHDRILGAFVSSKSPIPLADIGYCYETLQITA